MRLCQALLLLTFALFGLACALGAQEPAISLQKDYLGTTGYPRGVGFALAALSIGAIPWCLKKAPQAKGTEKEEEKAGILAPVLLAVAYVAGIVWLGFGLSTFFYLWLMPAFLEAGRRRYLRPGHFIYALAMTGVIEIFFRIFKIYQPQALLF